MTKCGFKRLSVLVRKCYQNQPSSFAKRLWSHTHTVGTAFRQKLKRTPLDLVRLFLESIIEIGPVVFPCGSGQTNAHTQGEATIKKQER